MRRSLSLAVFLLSAVVASAQKRPIMETDLFDFQWIGDMDLAHGSGSNSGKVVFVQASVAPDHSGYETALYLLDPATPGVPPVPLNPHATHDSSPRWSPDGTQIAFLRSVEREGRPAASQLYLMPATPGASPVRLTDKYKCIPTVMVRFPRESHELSRSGEPWHRVERLQNIVNWFDLYLMGKPEPQYNTTHVETCHT